MYCSSDDLAGLIAATMNLAGVTGVTDLFSKQSTTEIATKTAASKLSNGAAIVVKDLTKEPAKGLLHVLAHVQKSVPGLIETHHGLEAATAQLQAVSVELQDAQEGICSITSPATQQDLASLAASIAALEQLGKQQQQLLEQQQQLLEQHQQQLQQQQIGGGDAAGSSSNSAAGGAIGFVSKAFAWPRQQVEH